MQAVVVQFPGSNADFDAFYTLSRVLGIPTRYVFHKERSLPADTDLVVLPGGFSYGDYLRCGAIARFSNVMPAVIEHARRGGLLIGICNGFQILTETGLLPGALTRNSHLRFECRDVILRVEGEGAFTHGMRGETLRLPIAHGEGRFQADAETLDALERDGLVALRYAASPDPSLPANPNGSLRDIAGIYGGPRRNVLGLMPHPERASEPLLGSADGARLFRAAMRAAVSA